MQPLPQAQLPTLHCFAFVHVGKGHPLPAGAGLAGTAGAAAGLGDATCAAGEGLTAGVAAGDGDGLRVAAGLGDGVTAGVAAGDGDGDGLRVTVGLGDGLRVAAGEGDTAGVGSVLPPQLAGQLASLTRFTATEQTFETALQPCPAGPPPPHGLAPGHSTSPLNWPSCRYQIVLLVPAGTLYVMVPTSLQ